MLTPINILAYDSNEVRDAYAQMWPDEDATDIIYNKLLSMHGNTPKIIAFPLYGDICYKDDPPFMNRLAHLFIKNTNLNYGQTAYILY